MTPFKHLYQQFRSSNPRLVDVFDRIHEILSEQNDDVSPSVVNIVLTANREVPFPVVSNKLLIIVVRQDSVGGHTISWPSDVIWSPALIDTTALTTSTFLFKRIANSWVMIGQPATGMT